MIGAILISTPKGVKRRTLFPRILAAVTEQDRSEQALIISTCAVDDTGSRAKTSCICLPFGEVDDALLDPYPDSCAADQDVYDVQCAPLRDTTVFSQGQPPDIFTVGSFATASVPSRGTCVFSSLQGSVHTSDNTVLTEVCSHVPGDLLVRMSLDDSKELNFVNKAAKNILDNLHGRFLASVLSIGPDPLFILMKRQTPLYLYLMAKDAEFYFVWSDYEIGDLGSDIYRWPLDLLAEDLDIIKGFSIRMLRSRWVRWLSPPPKSSRVPKGTDWMRYPRAISALQHWITRHTATAVSRTGDRKNG